MRVLFLCNDYYPVEGACGKLIHNMFFEGGLVNQIEKIGVITYKKDYSDKDYEVIDSIHVYRTQIWSMQHKSSILSTMKKYPLKAFYGGVKRVFEYTIRPKFFPSAFLNPDICMSFFRQLKSINADKEYDIIIPVSGDVNCDAAVMKYSSKRDTKIVVYQTDPCGTNAAFDSKSKNKRASFENNLYQISDAIITTPLIYEEQKACQSEDIMKKVIPMEFPNVITKIDNNTNQLEHGKIICMFSGSIYAGARDPGYTLRLFKSILDDRIELHMVGVSEEDIPEEFKNMPIVCHGWVDQIKADILLHEADILINIGNKMANQIPSKLFQYISTGKPIVNVFTNLKCPTLPFMERYPLALCINENEPIVQQEGKLKKFLFEYANKRVDSSYIDKQFVTNTPEYCAKELLKVFKTVIDNR